MREIDSESARASAEGTSLPASSSCARTARPPRTETRAIRRHRWRRPRRTPLRLLPLSRCRRTGMSASRASSAAFDGRRRRVGPRARAQPRRRAVLPERGGAPERGADGTPFLRRRRRLGVDGVRVADGVDGVQNGADGVEGVQNGADGVDGAFVRVARRRAQPAAPVVAPRRYVRSTQPVRRVRHRPRRRQRHRPRGGPPAEGIARAGAGSRAASAGRARRFSRRERGSRRRRSLSESLSRHARWASVRRSAHRSGTARLAKAACSGDAGGVSGLRHPEPRSAAQPSVRAEAYYSRRRRRRASRERHQLRGARARAGGREEAQGCRGDGGGGDGGGGGARGGEARQAGEGGARGSTSCRPFGWRGLRNPSRRRSRCRTRTARTTSPP